MKKNLCAIAFAASVFPAQAISQTIPGNGLYEACTADNGVMNGFCIGYLIGQIEGQFLGALLLTTRTGMDLETSEFNDFANNVFNHCITENASNEQLMDVVVKYMRENPEIRHETARFLVWQAYQEAFPCGGNK